MVVKTTSTHKKQWIFVIFYECKVYLYLSTLDICLFVSRENNEKNNIFLRHILSFLCKYHHKRRQTNTDRKICWWSRCTTCKSFVLELRTVASYVYRIKLFSYISADHVYDSISSFEFVSHKMQNLCLCDHACVVSKRR